MLLIQSAVCASDWRVKTIYRTFIGGTFLIPIILLVVFLVVVVWVVTIFGSCVWTPASQLVMCLENAMEPLRGGTLLEEVCCWRLLLKFYGLVTIFCLLSLFLSIENTLSFCFLTTMLVLSCCIKDFPLWWTVAPMELPVKINPFSFNLLFVKTACHSQ